MVIGNLGQPAQEGWEAVSLFLKQVEKWLYNYFTMSTVNVPTIDKRERIPQEAIDEVVKQIVEKFKPQKIILFGSYARGNPRPESDVDLLVVTDSPTQSLDIRRHLGVMFGLDLLVYTSKRLKERVDIGDWFVHDILKEGKVLYESSRR